MKIEFTHCPALYEMSEKSVFSWRARYIPLNGATMHITPYADFGVVPIHLLSRTGYLWLVLGEVNPPLGFLKEARRLFPSMLEHWGWRVVAFVEKGKSREYRFARYFGFQEVGEDADFHYLRRN